ncbi:unnamed protein product [Cladocopium goreaui]|uniref:Uncharacterized protein n=1 Tax=Cladocopium goreaui TaxID=2562237 RepID=A0A9P1DGX8_9DINO|nr:unnamed protein product [Cladocopium goreaui]
MASQQPNQLRDFHAEIREVLSQKDPTFKPSFAAMWVDNLPEESEDPFSKADENLENLSKVKLHSSETASSLQGTLKSRRTAKVLHLKNQNLIGASVVKSYMESNACFKAGVPWEDPEATIAAEKYLQDVLAKSGAVLLWGDLTKLGKITGKELDSMAHVVSSVIRQKPTMSAAFLVAPVMAKTNIRTEMRSTRRLIPFAAETSYIVPSAERDSLPHASEGMRSLSDTQESAQFLSGKAFPEAILTALLTKTALPSKLLGIVNCTPYDCWLERVCVEHLCSPAVIFLSFGFGL